MSRFRILRSLVHARAIARECARRCLVGASCCAGVLWWTVHALTVTGPLALLSWLLVVAALVSGE